MKEADEYYEDEKPAGKSWQFPFAIAFAVLIAIAFVVVVYIIPPGPVLKPFTDGFKSVSEDTLEMRGWSVRKKDATYWKRRDEKSGHLTLFTLDNSIGLRNIVIRKIEGDCFVTEIRVSDFVPQQDGRQAGMILLENTDLIGQAVSFYMGYKKLVAEDSTIADFTGNDSGRIALRIVKEGKKFSFLYATAPIENYSFKEVYSKEFTIEPKYIALFASGNTADSTAIPASFDHFSFIPDKCPK